MVAITTTSHRDYSCSRRLGGPFPSMDNAHLPPDAAPVRAG